ncbi:MAG: ethanolamine ammonia-lyase subunit EutC [Desulfobacteraceae bacterium]|nr:MAG: ethanolamine ammonia-lyase subunit EutC [Desulfobacteraceae bacterium]
MSTPVSPMDVLKQLQALTPARIGLNRSGSSISTREMLKFDLDHAHARDAVHLPFAADLIEQKLRDQDIHVLRVQSRANDRTAYLQRPDLGRLINGASLSVLEEFRSTENRASDLCIIVADGLSTRSIHDNALPFMDHFRPIAYRHGWSCTPVVIAEQARVAIADDIGSALGARISIILIGERPGLSASDSMGIYMTWAPKKGRTDAQRNCISNIRPQGLDCPTAARELEGLITSAMAQKVSGVEMQRSDGLLP